MRFVVTCLLFFLAACARVTPAEEQTTQPQELRGAAPARDISTFLERIDERMTEGDVLDAFGTPDKDIGSGIHIYVYALTDGTEVWIGLADRVLYARNVDAEGNLIEVLTDGAVLASMDGEPVTWDVSGLHVRKRLIQSGFLSALCGNELGEHALYALTDRDESTLYTVSVLPNTPRFADKSELEAAFGCNSLPLIALNEQWLVFGLRSSDNADARAAEAAVLSSIRLR